MTKATREDESLIIGILAKSFYNNNSVNYIIRQDHKRAQRIQCLMRYAFEYCYLFGDIFLSDDKKGCALIIYPDKKKITLQTILLDLQLIYTAVGFQNIKKAVTRESMINRIQPEELKSYIWFIGVDPIYQHQGIGSTLLREIIQDSERKGRPIYLETSTLKNIPWYQRFGFTTYHKEDTGYPLFFLKRGLCTSGL